MKKILSVLLAVMMLFGALSISSSAANYVNNATDAKAIMAEKTAGTDNYHVVICYNVNGGTMKNAVRVYDKDLNNFTPVEAVSGYYFRIPENANDLYIGQTITLPTVTAPDGYQFDGWFCANESYAANGSFEITYDKIDSNTGCIEIKAGYSPSEIEGDTMATVMNILIKVFGAIIGILFYNADTAAGVKLMEQILGGIMG